MVHDELGGGGEVGLVELVRDVPAEGSELSALLQRVCVCEREKSDVKKLSSVSFFRPIKL